jgi:hypothetical protein
VGGFEVLAEELEGEAEEGLVLGKTVSWECERWGGGPKRELTRMRCVSGFSLEVMWSAMLLWRRKGAWGRERACGGLILE